MRQVFTSPRVENVESVARLLEDAGIEVRITHGRGWKGAIRGNFSYRDHAPRGPQPAVWVIRSDQQPQARQLLRDAGLLQSTRPGADGFLAPTLHAGTAGAAAPARPPGRRIKLGLLLTIGAVLALAYGGFRRAASNADADDAQARGSASAVAVPTTHTVPTPPALAELLVAAEARTTQAGAYCVAIDGRDPDAATMGRLRAAAPNAFAASACPATAADRLALDVRDYTTDGTGVGTVRLDLSRPGAGGPPQTRRLEVERTGPAWRVRRTLPPQGS